MKKLKYHIYSQNKPKPIKLEKTPTIDKTSIVDECSFGKYVEIGAFNNISESSFDDFTYTSENCQIIYTEIGKCTNIASYVRINPGQHPMDKPCQHHMLYRKEMFGLGEDDKEFFQNRRNNSCKIGSDVWIGHNVVVMGGVKIGNGAVIGSSSVVTKDIPPYAIVVGNPAKVIKYRFDEKTIKKLEKIAWWEWETKKIKEAINDFEDIKAFIKKHE